MFFMHQEYVYAFTIWAMMHRIKNGLDQALAPFGITHQQARALGTISALNALEGSRIICQKDLEAAIGLRGSSISSLLKGLEKGGFIQRLPGQEDGRRKRLLLTEKGQRLNNTFLGIFNAAEKRITHNMSDAQKKDFLELLHMALHNLEEGR